MTLQPKFATDALDRLAERVDYEEWFLEAIHSIAEQELFPSWPDAVIYPINQPKAIYHTFGGAHVILGDWRPGFLAAGAPLIFICTFKILDMLIEWILNENGFPSTFRFQEKLKNLKNSPKFPPVIECRPWLQERLIGLYAELEPLRGTIIHDKHFTSTGGGIEVSSSKKGAIGPTISISADSLRKLGLTIGSILKYVKGTWLIDDFREKLLRRHLDELSIIHKLPSLGQKYPFHTQVRFYTHESNLSSIDPKTIAKDLCERYTDYDCSFDLRVLVVENQKVMDAYFFPWQILTGQNSFWQQEVDIKNFKTDMPNDIKSEHLY